jgi:hypothetical protein
MRDLCSVGTGPEVVHGSAAVVRRNDRAHNAQGARMWTSTRTRLHAMAGQSPAPRSFSLSAGGPIEEWIQLPSRMGPARVSVFADLCRATASAGPWAPTRHA